MTTFTATEAKKGLYNLLDEVNLSHDPIQIVGKNHSAILIAEEDWRAIQETLYLTSVPGMREAVKEGMEASVDECVEQLEW